MTEQRLHLVRAHGLLQAALTELESAPDNGTLTEIIHHTASDVGNTARQIKRDLYDTRTGPGFGRIGSPRRRSLGYYLAPAAWLTAMFAGLMLLDWAAGVLAR